MIIQYISTHWWSGTEHISTEELGHLYQVTLTVTAKTGFVCVRACVRVSVWDTNLENHILRTVKKRWRLEDWKKGRGDEIGKTEIANSLKSGSWHKKTQITYYYIKALAQNEIQQWDWKKGGIGSAYSLGAWCKRVTDLRNPKIQRWTGFTAGWITVMTFLSKPRC